MFDSDRSYKDFMLGVVIGGSLGALLFNTEQGKKVQKNILNKYHKMSGAARDYLKEEVKKRISTATRTKKRKSAKSRAKRRK
jgi:gas vesicle protein